MGFDARERTAVRPDSAGRTAVRPDSAGRTAVRPDSAGPTGCASAPRMPVTPAWTARHVVPAARAPEEQGARGSS
ncbi:hypothetical protein ACFWFI_19555 [Streptomyces sp. NPDC060209]|uniref:hypothetical protein n=1 Tax=Streptomyces sp. NPDC060209 TaxID=3347073 RepID=UPI0036694983